MSAPPILSLPADGGDDGPDSIRRFLERLVSESATRACVVIGEAELGRHILVSPPLEVSSMKQQIDEAIALVLETLGKRWPGPHVTDFGLREMYTAAREPWLAPLGFEDLVKDGKVGVATIFCHEWVYDVCHRVAVENGLTVQTPLEEYVRTGKFRVAATNAFQIDVFANLRDMAANFDTIDALATKVLVLAAVSGDERLAERMRANR